MIGFYAKGLGSAEKGIESLLNKHYKKGMSEREGCLLVLGILKQVMEEKIKEDLVELVLIRDQKEGFVNLGKEEISRLIKDVPELN